MIWISHLFKVGSQKQDLFKVGSQKSKAMDGNNFVIQINKLEQASL